MNLLSCRDLVVTRQGRELLGGVSLDLRPGTLTAVVGPNGAGKTTLLRCLAGLVEPDAGEVLLDGSPLASHPGPVRTRALGYVPQRFEPAWDYGVREILMMGAERVGGGLGALDPLVAEHELGAILDRRWSRLSGGERARALFASVAVANPSVLLADEPGASLDVRHRYGMLARLRAYSTERTVVVVLHELDLALRLCDRIVVMSEGSVVVDDAASVVARSPDLDSVFGVAFERVAVEKGAVPLAISRPGPA